MKKNWELDDLIEHFTIMQNEMSLVGNKTGETRLGFVVLLKFFQMEARFPNSKNEIPKLVVEYIAKQMQLSSSLFENYDLNSRTYYNHKAQIREFFDFREPSVEDANSLTKWLSQHVYYHDADINTLKEEAYNRLRELHIEPPTPERIDRITKSAIYIYENQFFQDTFSKLSSEAISRMNNLINDLTAYEENEVNLDGNTDTISFSDLRAEPIQDALDLKVFLKKLQN